MRKTKECGTCKQRKPVSEFYKRSRANRDGTFSPLRHCKPCVIYQQSLYNVKNADGVKTYHAEYYKKHSAKWVQYRCNDANRHAPRNAFILALKVGNPCMDCGKFYPAECMDLDHVRGTKVTSLGMMMNRAYSEEEIMEEIEKCDLVCANCHRIRTAARRRM